MKRIHRADDEETSYWLSYSDMMAALLLVFVLIITFTMMQAKMQYEEKENELIEQKKALAEQQELIQSQEKELAEQESEMKKQQEQLDSIIGVRSDLVAALKEEFDGSDLHVKVDANTGAITFDSNVLFDTNKSEIKDQGKDFLQQFLPRYFKVLLDPDFKQYISEIIIEGHTDTKGDYIYNLELSQARAFSVATFCLRDDADIVSKADIEELRDIVTANGRSFSDPVYNSDNTINMDASRRVEFKFRLKDEEMVEEMINILNN